MAGTIFPSILPDADDREHFDAGDAPAGEDAALTSDADLIDEGICPWCPEDVDREFENVGSHAAQAHSDAYEQYRDGSE